MADRFPLILNTSANQIQEIASGDTLDLTDVNISNAGVITATSFAGDGSGLIGVASTDNIVTGTAATFNTFPIDINAGMDVAGVSTFTGNIDANGDLDVDGHTNLDNVNIAGVTTIGNSLFANGNLTISNAAPTITLTDSDADDYAIQVNGGSFIIHDTTAGATRLSITDAGNVDINADLDVDGHTNLDNVSVAGVTTFTGDATFSANVSIGGTLTYEDVTNIDSVGIITARSDVKVGTGVTITPAGAGFFSGIVTATSFRLPSDKLTLTYGSQAPAPQFGGGTQAAKIRSSNCDLIIQAGGAQTTRPYIYMGNSSQRVDIGDGSDVTDPYVPTFQNGINLFGPVRMIGANVGIGTTNSDAAVTSANTNKLSVGIVSAYQYYGDGSNLSGITVGITTEQVTPSSNVATLDLSKDEHKIVASGTYTIDVNGGTESESHVIRIENSGISTVGFSTYFKFPSGGTPALPTASGAISLISFTVHKVGSVGIATVLLAGASVNYS